jgi:crotonobetainyl-CoA:carnitine CoA-transferase CaiB-like acyl-CoA transferase
MRLPLDGVKVLDLSQIFAGPTAGLHLADLGAEVIKVEPPWGEIVREWNTDGDPQRRATAYLTVNRGKRNIAVNTAVPDGREVLYRLVAWADVVISNTRMEAARRGHLDYETLRRHNPRLIFGQITGYGVTGKESERPAFDLLVQARSGVMSLRTAADGRPLSAPFPMADLSAAMLLAMTICAALYAREVTGEGSFLETSLLDAALAMQRTEIVRTSGAVSIPRRSYAFYNACRCADGRYVIFATQQDRRWHQFAKAMDLEHLAEDEAFATFTARVQNGNDLYAILEAAFLTRTADEWIQRFREWDVPAELIYTQDEVLVDRQARDNGMVISCPDDYFGVVDMVGPSFRVNGRIPTATPVPGGVGNDTAEVLGRCGFGPDEVADLARRSIVHLGSDLAPRDAGGASR